jgi:hypothetical protein
MRDMRESEAARRPKRVHTTRVGDDRSREHLLRQKPAYREAEGAGSKPAAGVSTFSCNMWGRRFRLPCWPCGAV